MARRDALLRLHKSLVGRRDELRRPLGGDLKQMQFKTAEIGDSADLAFDSGNEEVTSQLAELEARELNQVERALNKLKGGSYGLCEGCQKKIPVQRLNALPFSVMCVECQRELEMYGHLEGRGGKGDWGKVTDHGAEDKEIDLSDIEMDYSPGR